MEMQHQHAQNLAATRQADSTPSGCKACQRSGLPIFPLRVAAVPTALLGAAWQPQVPEQEIKLQGGEFKYALRTLRMGYLYVLLDNSVWQGYQVTEAGHLRQFNPLVMPQGDTVEPLSEACRTQNHEIVASFINIDDTKYSQAWLAFSSDPWCRAVLDEYQSGVRPASRFTKITLADFRSTPASVEGGYALDASLSVLQANVVEFATDHFANAERLPDEPDGGVHGFYPWQAQKKRDALGDCVSQLAARYQCQIAALALDDSVGVVQELNNARLQVVEARQNYNNTPEVYHRHMVSLAIEQYLAAKKQVIDDTSKPSFSRPASGYPMALQTVASKEQVAAKNWGAYTARLQKSYREAERTAFMKDHQRKIAGWQQRLDAIGLDLATAYGAQSWLCAIEHDYAPLSSPLSWVRQFVTLTACIQGGATDEAMEQVWHDWLKDNTSPVWFGLLGNDKSVLDAVYGGLGGYTNLKVLLGSDEVSRLLNSTVMRRALVQRSLAISSAMSRLALRLESSALEGYARVVQGLTYLTSEKKVTLFELKMTVGEYQQMLREMARVRLDATGKPAAFHGELSGGQQTLRSAAMGGGPVSVSDPVLLQRSITVTLVSDMPEDKLAAALRRSGTSSAAVQRTPLTQPSQLGHFSELRIKSFELAGGAGSAPITLNPVQLQEVIKEQAQMYKRILSGNTLGLGLSAGMMYLQVFALEANRKALEASIGNDTKARLALLSNMTMVVSSVVESAGFIRTLAMAKPWSLKGVHWLIRAGGAIAGFASIIDGIGMGMRSIDASIAGDSEAAKLYFWAALSTIAGARYAILAARASLFCLAGPAGIAMMLIIVGATLAVLAENALSTAIEIWLRRTCFGLPRRQDVVWKVDSLDDLKSCLTAFNAITGGMTAEVGYQDKLSEWLDGEDLIKMRVVLPGCDTERSSWSYSLSVPTSSGKSAYPLLARTHNIGISTTARLEPLAPGTQLDAPPLSRPGIGTVTQRWEKGALVIEGEAWVNRKDFSQAELLVSYRPDKNDPDGEMALTVTVED